MNAFAFGFGLGAGCTLVWHALSGPPSAAESWLWAHAEGRH